MQVPRKYGFLRFVAFILKLLAWLILALGIIGVIAGLVLGFSPSSGGLPVPRWQLLGGAGIAVVLLSIIWFVQLFAFGSVLSLLIDIEEDTRRLEARLAPPPAEG